MSADYDAIKDVWASTDVAYQEISKRIKQGGEPWVQRRAEEVLREICVARGQILPAPGDVREQKIAELRHGKC